MFKALAKQLANIVHTLTPCSWLSETSLIPPMDVILSAAEASLNAYGDTVPEGGFAYDLPNVNGRMVVRRIGNRVHVAIRGTANARNVILDLSARRVKDATTGLMFHEGFLAYAKEAWHILQPYLQKDDVVSFTGHSLGGAVAVILATKLSGSQPTAIVAPTITFGAPMVGDKVAAQAAARASNIVRVVNDNDLIPLLPISPKYWHSGTTLVFDSEGNPKTWGAKYAFLRGHSSWFGAVAKGHRRIGEEYNDHRMTEYLTAIQRIIGEDDRWAER